MAQNATVTDHILGAVAQAPGYPLDALVCELVFVCPDLTWNQVFLEIEHVSHTGRLRLQSTGRGFDTVWLLESLHDNQSALRRRTLS